MDIYDRKYDGYDREQCQACGEWMPWPALDDHACDDFDALCVAFYGETV